MLSKTLKNTIARLVENGLDQVLEQIYEDQLDEGLNEDEVDAMWIDIVSEFISNTEMHIAQYKSENDSARRQQ